MSDHTTEIKARVDIVDLVGSYVTLKKAGRNFKGLCPFHKESTPSFVVNPERQFCWCFGCNRGGDIFTFVQEIENVDFPTALRTLAQKAGVQIEKFSGGVGKEKKERLRFLHEKTTRFYEEQLKQNPIAKDYLAARGVAPETIADFRLGWAPESYEATIDFLRKENFTDSEIVEGGIGAKKDLADTRIYDRFRGRLMIPIADISGTIIGFGGRVLDKGEPKYLNSPETPIYHKSHLLFAFDCAKKTIKELDCAVVVEGYMDVISSHQAGVKNVVASSGTALTEEQLKLISRYTKTLILSFDADAAGAQAAYRGITLAQKAGFDIRILRLPAGKDPDECIRRDPALWKKALDEAVPVFDFVLQNALKKNTPENVAGKKALAAEVLPFIADFQSAIEQEECLKKLAQTLGVSAATLEKELNFTIQSVLKTSRQATPRKIVAPAQFSREDYLLGLLLVYSENLAKVSQDFATFCFVDKANAELYNLLQNAYNNQVSFTPRDFVLSLDTQRQERANQLMFLAEKEFPEVKLAEENFKVMVDILQKSFLAKKRENLTARWVEARQNGDEEGAKELYTKMNQVSKSCL